MSDVHVTVNLTGPGAHVEAPAKRDPYDCKTWGSSCGRGFVSDSRFGSDQVIKRTNRSTSRKWRKLDEKK